MWSAVAFIAALVGGGLILRGVFGWGFGFIVVGALIAAYRIGRDYSR